MNKGRIGGAGGNSPVDSLSRRGSQEQLPTVNKHPSAEDSSATEVSGLEPATTTSTQPLDATVTISANKLIKSGSGSPSTSSSTSSTPRHASTAAQPTQQDTTQPGAMQVGAAAVPLPAVAVPQQLAAANDPGCCTGAVKYAVVGGVALSVLAAGIALFGAYADQSDNLEEQALRSHMGLSAGLSALGGGLVGAGFGWLYHYLHHRLM